MNSLFLKRKWKSVVKCLMICLIPVSAQAQADYPNRPIQMIVAYPAGGGTDTLARIFSAEFSKVLGVSVIVVNKPGASGLIGTTFAARSHADGYTLLLDTGNSTSRPAVDPATPFKPSDFSPIALLTESPVALAISQSLPVKNVEELVSYSKNHPNTINYASTGAGSAQHLVSELMKLQFNLDWQEVPYQGGAPALTDLSAGRVQVMFSNPVPLMPYAQTGRLKVLAVTSKERLKALSSIPTMQESGISNFQIQFWNGVLAPAGTPKDALMKLSAAAMKVMEMPTVQAALIKQGSVLNPMLGKPFEQYMSEDYSTWAEIARKTHYSPAQ